jgi:hypothetical protein
MNRITKTLWDLAVSYVNWRHPGVPACHFLTTDDTLLRLESEPKTFIRWGDGESTICFGDDIYFQPYHPALRRRLMDILRLCRASLTPPFCLGITSLYLQMSREELVAAGQFKIWRRARYIALRMSGSSIEYLDAYVFKGTEPERYRRILRLWEQADNLVVVHPDPSVVLPHRIGATGAKMSFVAIPQKDAFKAYPEILKKTLRLVNQREFRRNPANRVLVCGGPCAKVLAYDLSLERVVVHDVGKFFSSEACHLGRSTCERDGSR